MRFEIPGKPVPKGRPRVGAGGRVFTPPKTRAYEEMVAMYARAEGQRVFGNVAVSIVLWSTRALQGDIDNYAKAVLDGLVKGQMIEDDRQVKQLDVRLVVGSETEKVVVKIEPLK